MKAVLFLIAISACAQSPQNPSPMVEPTCIQRRQIEPPAGRREKLTIGTLCILTEAKNRQTIPLLVHFHGSTWLPEQSAHQQNPRAAYAKPFQDKSRFAALLAEAANLQFKPIYLSGFSAG